MNLAISLARLDRYRGQLALPLTRRIRKLSHETRLAPFSAAGLTGMLATLAAALLAGGYATVHRITV